jgi:hypothetical protein
MDITKEVGGSRLEVFRIETSEGVIHHLHSYIGVQTRSPHQFGLVHSVSMWRQSLEMDIPIAAMTAMPKVINPITAKVLSVDLSSLDCAVAVVSCGESTMIVVDGLEL